jgi:hypothetical protein
MKKKVEEIQMSSERKDPSIALLDENRVSTSSRMEIRTCLVDMDKIFRFNTRMIKKKSS